MKQNEFDKLVTENYDQGEFEYNPANWDKMAGQLDAEKEKKRRFVWMPLMSVAASLLVLISIAGWLITRSGSTAGDAAVLAAKDAQTKMVPTKPVVPVTPKAIEPVQAPAQANTIAAANTNVATDNTTPNNHIAPTAHAAANHVNSVTNNYKPVYGRKAAPLFPMAALAPEQGQPAPLVQQNRLHMAEKETTTTRPSVFGSSVATKPQIDLAAQPAPLINGDIVNAYQPEESVKANRVMISLSGGINYGSLNRGYAMGFNAHTRVGQHFYVEGDLALVNNMGGEKDQYIPITQGNSLASYSRGTANTPTTPATTPKAHFYNLFYAQLTPTFGANVYKHLSVGAGADFQRLLQNNSLMTITNNSADAKEVPLYDMGLVGKTEYAITREVKASVLYRKGFNNFLYSSDKYVDRDYIQFQLKFTILKR